MRSPEKPERIINNANAPTITPNVAIIVIILIALFPLLAKRYLLAMYNGKFILICLIVELLKSVIEEILFLTEN